MKALPTIWMQGQVTLLVRYPWCHSAAVVLLFARMAHLYPHWYSDPRYRPQHQHYWQLYYSRQSKV